MLHAISQVDLVIMLKLTKLVICNHISPSVFPYHASTSTYIYHLQTLFVFIQAFRGTFLSTVVFTNALAN